MRWIAAGALAAAFVALDPAHTLGSGWGRSVVVMALIAAAQIGAGAAILRWRAPDLLEAPGGWAFAFGIGVGVHAGLQFVLAAAGLATLGGAAGIVGALGCGWIARPGVALPRLPVLAGGLLLAPALVAALAPPNDTDEIYQHLALARLISDSGGMPGGWDHPDGSRPLVVHLVFSSLYGLGGEAAPRLWHLALSAGLLLAVRDFAAARFGEGRGNLGALALLGSYSFLHEAGLAYNDLPAALWLLLAAEAMLRGRDGLLGLFAGLALAAKYTSAPVVIALGGAWLIRERRFPRGSLWALAPLAPWWVRNQLSGLHPLFPYAGWPDLAGFAFVYPEKYGMGRSAVDWLLLPWRILTEARLDSFDFLGRVNLLWIALPAAWWVGRRNRDALTLAGVFVVGFAGWAAGAQLLRYLLPLGGIAAYSLAALPVSGALILLFVASLPANLVPEWKSAADRVDVLSGKESRDAFLTRTLPAWPALRYLRDHVPVDQPVALLYAWHGYYVNQPWTLGSVEDHVPTRYWIATSAGLPDLRERGVRWLFVGDIAFLKKGYEFLPREAWQEQFVAPTEKLRSMLERDATRVFVEDRWEVWRLDEPEAAH